MKQTTFKCVKCREKKPINTSGGTGYSVKRNGHKICYECMAILDREYMNSHDKIDLYLSQDTENRYYVSNWPGSFKIGPVYVKKGNHNIARSRYDTWFTHNNQYWHGVQYGENTQIVHCHKVKQ